MTWQFVALVLGLVWWLPVMLFIAVMISKQQQEQAAAANLKTASEMLDKLRALG